MSDSRISLVAKKMYLEIYENSFGGKDRGRFLVSREHLKRLLGVPRLRSDTIDKLSDACLAQGGGLVMTDMDDVFAFCEKRFVSKWRRMPQRLVEEKVAELDAAEALDQDGEDFPEEIEDDFVIDDE